MLKIFNKKRIIIHLVLMFVIFIFIFFIPNKVKAASEYDYIIIGDSRTAQMYAAFTGNWKVIVKNNTKIDGKEVMFLGAGSQGYNYWFNQNSNYQDIKSALSKAKSNAKCFIWLGINDLGNVNSYPNAVNTLATNYPNVQFYYCSVTAINEAKYRSNYPYNLKNQDITSFNTNLSNSLKTKSRYNKNLFYINIQDKNITINGTTKTLYKWITENSSNTSDGLHYNTTLSKAIWSQAMVNSVGNLANSLNNNGNVGSNGGGTNGGTNVRTNTSVAVGEARNSVEFKDVLDNTNYYANVGDISASDQDKMESKISKVLSAITNIGILCSLIMPAIIGIKYMLGSKVEAKKEIVPYLVGSFMIFAICTIVKIVQSFGNEISK